MRKCAINIRHPSSSRTAARSPLKRAPNVVVLFCVVPYTTTRHFPIYTSLCGAVIAVFAMRWLCVVTAGTQHILIIQTHAERATVAHAHARTQQLAHNSRRLWRCATIPSRNYKMQHKFIFCICDSRRRQRRKDTIPTPGACVRIARSGKREQNV